MFNCFGEIRKRKGSFLPLNSDGQHSTSGHMHYSYKPSELVFISLFYVLCGTRDAVITREMALEKNGYLKSIQVNVLKSVTIMKKRSDRIHAD